MSMIIKELQDMRYLEWSRIRHSSGTAGTFLKAYDDSGRKKIYYKLSDFDSIKGVLGHECVNELIVDRMLEIMEIPHLEYTLINALVVIDNKEYKTYLCASEDYKEPDESKLALEDYYQMESLPNESSFDFCVRKGWRRQVSEMIVTDYLICNRDRHGANIEVLRNRKNNSFRLAPMFDQGLSFLCRCRTDEEIERFDVTEDRRVQTFFGGSSAQDNLRLLEPEDIKNIRSLKKRDRKAIFDGLEEVCSGKLLAKIWDMMWMRNSYLDSMRTGGSWDNTD